MPGPADTRFTCLVCGLSSTSTASSGVQTTVNFKIPILKYLETWKPTFIPISALEKPRSHHTFSTTDSSALSAVPNHLKPHKSEAIQRLRYNALCLFTTLVISYLMPLPSLPSALRFAFRTSQHVAWSREQFWEWMCQLG